MNKGEWMDNGRTENRRRHEGSLAWRVRAFAHSVAKPNSLVPLLAEWQIPHPRRLRQRQTGNQPRMLQPASWLTNFALNASNTDSKARA
jgi:hypothetical protein